MGDNTAAILTPTQREYLTNNGHQDTPDAAERAMRSRIRDRVKQGVKDFSILFEHWPEEEREKVFFREFDGEVEAGTVDLLALLYGELKVTGRFKNLLLRGVTKAERRAAGTDQIRVKTNFEVEEVERVDVDRAVRKYLRGDLRDMTEGEKSALLRTLYESGAVSAEEAQASKESWEQQLRRQLEEDEGRTDHWREKQRRYGESQSSDK